MTGTTEDTGFTVILTERGVLGGGVYYPRPLVVVLTVVGAGEGIQTLTADMTVGEASLDSVVLTCDLTEVRGEFLA